MRRAILFFAVVSLVLVGLVPPAGAGPKARPFMGSATLQVIVGPELDGTCDAVDGWRTDMMARGTATHLGLFTFAASHCTPDEPEDQYGIVSGGQMTIVAANGDSLDVQYDGYTDPWVFTDEGVIIITAHLSLSIVGGTGRFEDATGEAQMDGSLTVENLGSQPVPGAATWVGTLSY